MLPRGNRYNGGGGKRNKKRRAMGRMLMGLKKGIVILGEGWNNGDNSDRDGKNRKGNMENRVV